MDEVRKLKCNHGNNRVMATSTVRQWGRSLGVVICHGYYPAYVEIPPATKWTQDFYAVWQCE